MSDFLTRIARLTRGETTAVKPRLPSHFAPLPDSQPAELPQDVPSVHRSAGREVNPESAQSQPAPSPERAAPGKRASSQETGTSELRAVDIDTAAHAPMMRLVDIEDAAVPGLSFAGTPRSARTDGEPAHRQVLTGLEWADQDFGAADDTEIQTDPFRPAGEADPVHLHESGRAAPTPSAPAHPKLLVRTQPAGREDTVLPDLPGLPETPRHTPGEPVVHINIGRIEVKASTPAPQPQARPAPARQQSSLSLQDYLARGQTGGKHS